MMIKKKTEFQLLQDKNQQTIDTLNNNISELGTIINDLYDSLNEIQSTFDKIKNIPSEKKYDYSDLKTVKDAWKEQVDFIEKNYNESMIKSSAVGVAGAGAGVAVATMGPSAMMGLATTFGVTSGGTAISTLSGASATNAALAWLGGGSIASGGGGMAAGKVLLGLAGPVGWSIAGVVVFASGIGIFKKWKNKKSLENFYSIILNRDINKYKLAIAEIKERKNKVKEETEIIIDANEKIKDFGLDYKKMTNKQKYSLGSYVNLMNSTVQLLVNPIVGLQPYYSEEDYEEYACCSARYTKEFSKKYKNLIISLANLLWGIDTKEFERCKCHPNVFIKSLKKNEKYMEATGIDKKDFDFIYLIDAFNAIKYKKDHTE